MKNEKIGSDLTISVSNFHMSYDEMGEGIIPVIFLHGFPFDKTMWAEQLEFLKSSYRVIAVDIRGFGQSVDEESELSIEMFADDLIALMDALYIEKAVVCGLSMGGFITLNAHQRFPERFEALIL
ncbi:alpha/beta fold hydrolase [Aquiflexum gelatinilyticum]|uniref:Alpha/beta hydrolase n=1 Tax=Aquiflexum gelatinilyticum TaxID=2961943 RepID=A0A9X2T095_9BACT|nr:alpha/beta hydrolase [Aquiflexum gelatinilyticum]MCR9013610.1 alpha/beta hydrolase [Aquiflexum gelatinilyticum]